MNSTLNPKRIGKQIKRLDRQGLAN